MPPRGRGTTRHHALGKRPRLLAAAVCTLACVDRGLADLTNSAVCPATIESSTDYAFGKQNYKFVNVTTIDECCTACASDKSCLSFSYCTDYPCPRGHGGGRAVCGSHGCPNCHLRSGVPGTSEKCPGMASGVMPGRHPPAPPPGPGPPSPPSPPPPGPGPAPPSPPSPPPGPLPTGGVYVPASDPAIRYVGRFDHTETGASFDRNGCEIVFRTEGPVRTVTAQISQILSRRNQMTNSKPHTFLVYVDGKPINKSIAGSECTYCTFDTHGHPNATAVDYLFLSEADLAPVGSPHEIRVMKSIEPEWGAKIPSPNWLTFHGLVLNAGNKDPADAGKIAAPSAARREHRIEFIGDSITAGMCNLCTSGHPSNYTMESFALSWPTVICETIGAECSTVAISGYGLVSNCCGKTGPVKMPEVWRRTLATRPTGGRNAWNFSDWVPDALVVNLGTNDWESGPRRHGGYVEAYIELIKAAHSYYGDGLNAFLACGPSSPLSFASRPARRVLLAPQINPRSLYRCGTGTSSAACELRQEGKGPETRPKTTLRRPDEGDVLRRRARDDCQPHGRRDQGALPGPDPLPQRHVRPQVLRPPERECGCRHGQVRGGVHRGDAWLVPVSARC